MSKFKVGDRVRLAKSSEYYGDNDNPIHVDGKVIEVRNRLYSSFGIEVDWDNGMYNSYRESDLELVESKPQFKVGHGAICIKKTHEHNVGDVLLVINITPSALLDFGGDFTYSRSHFTPCPNQPRTHYKERIAYALGADIETQQINSSWRKVTKPQFYGTDDYRVSIPDIHAKKRKQLQAEIARLQSELDNLGGDL